MNTSDKITKLVLALEGEHMTPEISKDRNVLLVGTTAGVQVIPCDTLGLPDPPPSDDSEAVLAYVATIAPYCEGVIDPEDLCSPVGGYVCRLSASGYLDATSWEYCDTEGDVLRWLEGEAESSGIELPYLSASELKARLTFAHIHGLDVVRLSEHKPGNRHSCGRWDSVTPIGQARDDDHILLSHWATGSDYSGDSVTLANFRELEKLWHDGEASIIPLSGGYGTYGICISLDTPESVWEIITALADYPCINDEAVSEVEMEWQEEALPDLEKDMGRELANMLPGDCLDATEERIATLVGKYSISGNVEWHYEHSNAYASPSEEVGRMLSLDDFREPWLDLVHEEWSKVFTTGPVMVRVITEEGTCVEEFNCAEGLEDADIIKWMQLEYCSDELHVEIFRKPCHPLDMKA